MYRFEKHDKVLLVGEGNFSFSVSLLKLNETSGTVGSVEVTATCFEMEDDSTKLKKDNIHELGNKGVTILQNVDATKLREHPVIGTKKFKKIIFNFPHVGGKMKIHLNRKLLSDFFMSARDVLEEDGLVLVTLCDGQGGTTLDKTQRRWDDTWKVVEMAAYGDFVLSKAFLFPSDLFPDYVSVGYRSQDKGFHVPDAVVHEFKIRVYPLLSYNETEIDELFQYKDISTSFEQIKLPRMHFELIRQNNLNESAAIYWFNFSKNIFKDFKVNYVEDITLIYGSYCSCAEPINLVKRYFKSDKDSVTFYSALRLQEVNENFSEYPVTHEIIIDGEQADFYANYFISKFFCSFQLPFKDTGCDNNCNSTIKFCIEGSEIKFLDVISINNRKICLILLDNLLKFVLYEKYCKLQNELYNLKEILYCEMLENWFPQAKVSPLCLSKSKFIFDISISIKDQFSEHEFFNVLFTIAGDIIIKVQLIDTYEPENKKEKRFCYRIIYASLKEPLFRERVVYIHQSIIASALEKRLKVTVL